MTTDIIDEIDNVIIWYGDSRDAAVWTAPFDEPIIQRPDVVRRLVDVNGWDGYAAHAYTARAVHVSFRALTENMTAALTGVKAAFDRIAEAARSWAPSVAKLATMVEQQANDDPRARALTAVRTRNTGPSAPRLDGRRP